MSIIRKAVNLFRKRHREVNTAANPATDIFNKNIDDADMIIGFVENPRWPQYEDYLHYRLGKAVDDAFGALGSKDDRAMVVAMSRAQVYYELLRDVDKSLEILKREQRRADKPL